MSREPLADVKFKKPKDITKHGLPMEPRTPIGDRVFVPKFCDMSVYVEHCWKLVDCYVDYTSRTTGGTECQSVIVRLTRRQKSRCRNHSRDVRSRIHSFSFMAILVVSSYIGVVIVSAWERFTDRWLSPVR